MAARMGSRALYCAHTRVQAHAGVYKHMHAHTRAQTHKCTHVRIQTPWRTNVNSMQEKWA